MKKRIGSYPRVRVQGDGRAVVSQGRVVLLVETGRPAGLEELFVVNRLRGDLAAVTDHGA